MDTLFGMPIYENRFATATEQIKKHRKKRINKKWLKRYGTKQAPCVYVIAGKLTIHLI